MDPLMTPGGFLGGFLLGGIFLPITVSFVLDGIVLYFRGHGPARLIIATAVTAAMVGLYSLALQNVQYAGTVTQLNGEIGLILWFSIPAAALGFAVRMLAIGLNPTTKQLDREVVAKRAAKHSAHVKTRELAHHA